MQTAVRHPRLRYVLDVVGADLGYRFRYFNDRSVLGTPEPRFAIRYGGGGERCLPHHPLLSGKHPTPADTAPAKVDGLPYFFPVGEGYDLLACIFYALSRYEEYAPFRPDAHGRFPASASHARQQGYLHRPVVRAWTAALGRQLRTWFPDLPPPRRPPFALRPTYDIDLLWAYRYRGRRGLGSLGKDLFQGHFCRARSRITAGGDRDPYFTLPRLEDLHQKLGLTPTYFWLLADRADRRDPNPYPIPETQRRWMQQLEATSLQGIHPGYRSSKAPAVFEVERSRMETLLGRSVTASRQHFLRFGLPHTYRALEAAGITDEYSMGYADAVGWRAGTNLPFPWYDLERERQSSLTIHPFAAMDVTLKNYENLSAEAAGAEIRSLATSVREFGGPFLLLWHNSSFAADYGWAGWWDTYATLLKDLSKFR